MESKKLFAGERFLLTDDTGFWRIVSGKVEVYATTQTGADISFHQCYLIDRAPGEAVFPAMDEFREIRMQVYVLEDAEMEFIPWQQVEMAELRLLMEDWFAALIKINWLRFMADKGDDVLQRWRRSKFFDQADSHEKLMTSFCEHEEILSMLLGVRFGASDKRLARHIRRREMAKVVLVENGIRSLLGEERLFSQHREVERGNKLTMDATFAVRQVAEEQAFSLWTKNFGEHWNWSLKLRWQDNYTSIIASIQPFVLTMILYWIAVYGMNEVGPDGKTVQTGIGYAQFIAFNAAYSSFNGVISGALGLISQYFAIQPQLENLRPILEAVPETTEEKQDAGQLTGSIEVSHLSFAYNHVLPDLKGDVVEVEGEEVLKDVSFSITAGENVAIVGKSGSGKSTLVRLLLGFETPKRGSISFDGQDLSELALPSVRSQMGVVLQNGQLMTGDIYTNIVGTRMLTQDDAWAAAEAAGIAEDIAAMPMGMQTVISEGSSNISGGQRQRILIARALVGRPAILIFDEATSALDNCSQAIVTRSLDRLKSTRIVVAHRLSTIRKCDRIIVMDEGRVAEMGSFDELVAKGGLFADLVKRQVTGRGNRSVAMKG